jgi:ribose transport system permease protein
MTQESSDKRRLAERIAPWGTVIALVVLIAVFGIAKPSEFISWGNFQTILAAGAGLGIVAVGLTLVLISGDFDLSVGAVATATGFAAALLCQHGWSIVPALLVAVLFGAFLGLINGFVTVVLNVSSFIATLAMLTVATGLATWWSKGESIPVGDQTFLDLSTAKVIGIPLPAVIALVIYAALWVVLERTRPGRMLYAAGANPEAARLAGIRVGLTRVVAFSVCSLLAAIAGVLLASRLSAAYHGAGTPYLLDAFAAAFVGAVTLRLGPFHIAGTAVGIALLTVLTNGLDVLGAPSYVAQLISGCFLIAAVAMAGVRARRNTAGGAALAGSTG